MDGRKAYLDSSVVLRRLLQQPGAIRDWSAWQTVVVSELMQAEVLRSLDRLWLAGRLSPHELARCIEEVKLWTAAFEEAPINRAVLARVGATFPSPLGALDAIHLATALLWSESNSEELTFLTHDRQLTLAARLCGLPVQTARA